MSHSVDIVVARHGENVDWVRDMKGCRVTIDDSEPSTSPTSELNPHHHWDYPGGPGADWYRADDAHGGGEAGAYLRAILRMYPDAFFETVVFTQANWGDHCSDNSFPKRVLGFLDKPAESYVPLGDPCEIDVNYQMGRPLPRNPKLGYASNPLRDFCLYVFGREPPPKWMMAHGAIFAVPREAILRRPREFYATLEEWVCHAPLTFETGLMERLWPLVFTEW